MRFSIRDVLWLTVVVAVLIGWGIEHFDRALAHQESRHFAELVNALKEHGIEVEYSKGTWWIYHK